MNKAEEGIVLGWCVSGSVGSFYCKSKGTSVFVKRERSTTRRKLLESQPGIILGCTRSLRSIHTMLPANNSIPIPTFSSRDSPFVRPRLPTPPTQRLISEQTDEHLTTPRPMEILILYRTLSTSAQNNFRRRGGRGGQTRSV